MSTLARPFHRHSAGDVAARQAADPFTSTIRMCCRADRRGCAGWTEQSKSITASCGTPPCERMLTVRNYGFFIDGTRYSTTTNAIPVLRNPFSTGTVVAYPTNVALTPFTDPYFRGFDNSLPDFWRFKEWERDFDANERRARPAIGGPAIPDGPRFADPGSLHARSHRKLRCRHRRREYSGVDGRRQRLCRRLCWCRRSPTASTPITP